MRRDDDSSPCRGTELLSGWFWARPQEGHPHAGTLPKSSHYFKVKFKSGAVHRVLQLGKVLVVSKAVGRTLLPSRRIIQYEDEKDMLAALMKARQVDTTPLPPRMISNYQQPGYRTRVQTFYRRTRP